jgi:hypothetical protein
MPDMMYATGAPRAQVPLHGVNSKLGWGAGVAALVLATGLYMTLRAR